MGDELLRILLFAAVAGFLIYRLRGVLGRRTGHERERRHPFGQRGEQGARHGEPQGESPQDNVIPLPERGQSDAEREEAPSLSAGLTQVRIADPSFDANQFVQGAGRAFEMIVEAFANGDTATLRPLLSDDLFDEFGTEIRRRAAEGETHESRIVSLREAEILEAQMEGRTAYITIKFVSDQLNAVRDENGEVIEGDPETPIEVVDIWTFARNTRASDPNWTLVETRTPN